MLYCVLYYQVLVWTFLACPGFGSLTMEGKVLAILKLEVSHDMDM